MTKMTKPIERISARKSYSEDDAAVDVGHGELYSPDHAIKIIKRPNPTEISESRNQKTMGVGKNLATVKDKVMQKLAAAAVPSEALENAKQFMEGVVRDVAEAAAAAAQGITKDALHRIKSHLVVILPSLSPATTRKMVDDAEEEANGNDGSEEDEGIRSKETQTAGKSPYVSPASSSLMGSLAKPFSRL